jgi:hypothetical protein
MGRNSITWFVPQFGTVQMFVNPEKIIYTHKKIIQKNMTKNGFSLQYWGEDLSTLDISGTTGSSGVEGLNALYEIYRAEQFAFDATGLTLASNNAAAASANSLANSLGSALGGALGGGLAAGVLGLSSPANTLSARNIPCLASLAFAVEMYYNGWVYRGYFSDMNATESSDDFRWHYNMKFIVTERRGYRTNYFPYQNSPVFGQSSYSSMPGGAPSSFSGITTLNTNIGVSVYDTSGGSIGGLISSLL